MAVLEKIGEPEDIKKLTLAELNVLAEEIRERILCVVEKNGGHLSSNLGTVDLIIALYYVFDFPKDKLLFDVGHQAYAHKILSGRNGQFDTLRQENGISGFTNIFESFYDSFCAGHAGDSISAALGYCYARDALKQNYFVIDVVGDGSLFNGENMEALVSDGKKPEKFLIILNDNGMSISKNDNGLYKFISKVSTKKSYSDFMGFFSRTIGGSCIGRSLKRFKRFIKLSLNNKSVIDSVGLKYIGIFDGNNIKELIKIFKNIKESPRATFLHVKTTKGKGLPVAEEHADFYHGIGKHFNQSLNSFSDYVGNMIVEEAKKDDKICAVCAGMKDGTGLKKFAEVFPKRFTDVGIAEEHAVTLAAGMAIAGMKPVVCIYSTFLQRSYDQIMMDVCLQKLPVIFCVDRAGFVGSDGVTHQGIFDLTYLRTIPNMSVFAPKDGTELKEIFEYALTLASPVAIRYPNGEQTKFETHIPIDKDNLWETASEGGEPYVLACGCRMVKIALEAKEKSGNDFTIVNARSVKPLDANLLMKIKEKRLITMEENVVEGGFGSSVLEFYNMKDIVPNLKIMGIKGQFVAHAAVEAQFASCNLTADDLIKII